MEKLLSSLVRAMLIKIVKRLDSLDSLDRKGLISSRRSQLSQELLSQKEGT